MRDNKTVLIKAEDATIATATVTIRTLQVTRRQMTQAVFRQLPEGRLVDEQGPTLLGIPWGWVNYHWGHLDPRDTHFLFQSGTTLFRCPFRVRDSAAFRELDAGPRPYLDLRERWTFEIWAHHLARILEGWRPDVKRNEYGVARWSAKYRSATFGIDDADAMPEAVTGLNVTLDGELLRAANDLEYRLKWYVDGKDSLPRTPEAVAARATEAYESRTGEARAALTAELVRLLGEPLSTAEISERCRHLERAAEDYFRRWDDLMGRLRGVEQLFIAC